MNAMWGAGQMMFNKILVLASPNPSRGGASKDSLNLADYEKVAREVFQNLNPATDIYFSQGPMDVLDHSCSKLGFGGKMCIDGTMKFEEEKDESYKLQAASYKLNADVLKNMFPEIYEVNTSLLKKEIPCLIISVEKNRKGHIRELHEQICRLLEIEGIKMILYVEHTVDANDLPTALWRFCNNLDPKRDHLLYKAFASAKVAADGQGTRDKVQDKMDEAPATSNQQPVSQATGNQKQATISRASVSTEQERQKNLMIFTATGPILLSRIMQRSRP
jgi:4-hydroxy-3-polyprenylbenzoate decarboxylase